MDEPSDFLVGRAGATFRRACCTLAIDDMNGADNRGREEKHQKINERRCEARVRETPEEREARLARRRQRPVILSGTVTYHYANAHKSLCSPSISPLITSLHSLHMTHSSQ